MQPADLDSITLHGMRFHTRIGVLPHEQEHAQPLEIDLTAWVAPTRGDSSVDYRTLYAAVRAAVDVPRLSYLEQLAHAIAERAFAEPAVQRVQVAIRKPHAAVGGPLDFAEVRIARLRGAPHA